MTGTPQLQSIVRTRGVFAALVMVLGLGWFALAESKKAPPVAEFSFHHDHIIGTSLDM